MSMETPDIQKKLQELKNNVIGAEALSADQIKAVIVDVLSYQIDLAKNLEEAEDYIGDDVPTVHVPVDIFSKVASHLQQFFANGPRARSWFVSWLIDQGCPEEVASPMFDELYKVFGIPMLHEIHMEVQAFMEGSTIEEYMAKLEAIQQQAMQQAQAQAQIPQGPQ